MNTHLRRWRELLICILLLATITFATAQPDEALPSNILELKPLEALISQALRTSPLLQVQQLNAANAQYELDLLKKEWAKYVAGVATLQAGNLQTGGDAPGNPNFVTQEIFFYGVGVQFRLPLSEFITRRERRAILTNKLEQEQLLIKDKELQIRELVIRQHEEVSLRLALIAVKARDLEFQERALALAEQYFRNGDLLLEGYAETASKRHRAEEALLEAQSAARLAFFLLRELVGGPVVR